jgi:O-antigen biosynthesis protein WbqV
MLDHSESALYEIDLAIRKSTPEINYHTVIGDVRDRGRVHQVFKRHRPELIFHAAALKHVPMVEANPIEGISTNVLGTVNVAEVAREFDADTMVLISSDKAVNPSSVMGASKRLAEMWCQACDITQGTRFVTVRFGNVLDSNGSVVPLFRRQIATGGPLTVTHPDMTRYFMTLREAVELVLHASVLGRGMPADGRIFVLDMGEPVKIVDLARQMIQLAGLKPDEDVEIVYTGARPGEKLHEEISNGEDSPVPTMVKSILVSVPPVAGLSDMNSAISEIRRMCAAQDLDGLTGVIGELAPEFRRARLRKSEPQEETIFDGAAASKTSASVIAS